MKKTMGSVMAVLALTLALGVPATAQAGECTDVTIKRDLSGGVGGYVSGSAPYDCEGCGPLMKPSSNPEGYVYTFNTGCPRL